MKPIEILKDRGFKVYIDLPFVLSNGAEFYVGERLTEAGIVAIMPEDESIYFLDKADLRKIAETAKTYGIEEAILYTNYGLELHSKHESPEVVGLTQIIKIDKNGNNH